MGIDALLAFLIHYRYAVIFPVTVVEGPIVGVLVGFLVTRGIFGFGEAYVILVLANLVGDTLWYLFGRLGRHRFIQRWGYLIGVTDPVVTALEHQFKRGAAKPLYLGKLAHGAGSFFIVAAGLANVPFWEFLRPTVIGTLPKTLLFLALGYLFGAHYRQIHADLGWLALVVFTAVIATAVMLTRRSTAASYEPVDEPCRVKPQEQVTER